jgi:O-antigen/teichoic acid export membrane protein
MQIAAKLRKIQGYIRFKPHDTSTKEGRAAERARRAGLTMLSSAMLRVSSILSLLITVPLTVGYLGAERYGVWMALTGFLTLLSLSDLGLGLGLFDAIAKASGEEDTPKIRSLISNTFLLLGMIAVGAGAAALLAVWTIPWNQLLKAPNIAPSELRGTLVAIVTCFCFNLPFSVVQRVQGGFQDGFESNKWQLVGSLGSIVLVLVAVKFHASMPVLVLAVSGFPVLVCLLNFSYYFHFLRPDLRPQLNGWEKGVAVSMVRTGLSFSLLLIGYHFAYSLDGLLLTNAAGPVEFTQFSVCTKVFGLLPSIVMMATTALWPAFAEARTRGDYDWVERTHRFLWRKGLTVAVIVGAVFVVFGSPLVQAWTKGKVVPSLALLVGCFLWSLAEASKSLIGPQMNGLGLIKFQTRTLLIYALVSPPIQWYAGHRGGATAFAWTTGILALLLAALPLALHLGAHIRELQRNRMVTPQAFSHEPNHRVEA